MLSHNHQWDFIDHDWIDLVRDTEDANVALELFINHDTSPARNRQAMYLLGKSNSPEPGKMYPWDTQGDWWLDKAKEHLDKLTVFGIADCYNSSMRVIAEVMGWPVQRTIDLAHNKHLRTQAKAVALRQLNDTWVVRKSVEAKYTKNDRWQRFVQPALVNWIKKWNEVDVGLHKYALQRFKERFRHGCNV
mmetsp:Transcript_105198/g.297313  ORF Transcript_105198/g.297313 Transcript_105198/m.297313 type:complete len:190 (-) Transcript_105198:83-652(-)